MNTRNLIEELTRGAWIPFNFQIGGEPASLQKLNQRERVEPDGTRETVLIYDVYAQPLQIWLTVRYGKSEERPLITWQATLRAEREIRDLIDAVEVFSLTLPEPDGSTPHFLRTFNGGGIFGYPEGEEGHLKNSPRVGDFKAPHGEYPPREFALTDHDLNQPVHLRETIEGRGSLKYLPIFFMQDAPHATGLWFGPEWSGSWELQAGRDDASAFCRVRLPRLRFRMLEGEEITLPAFSAGFYEGDIWEGHRHLRRSLRQEILPRSGQECSTLPATVYQLLGGNMPFFDAESKFRQVEKMEEAGFENLVFASCWYRPIASGTHFEEFADQMCRDRDAERPNWTNFYETCGAFRGSEERFPEGLDKFAEHLRERGITLGLWCDPRISRLIDEYDQARDVLTPYREVNAKDRIWNLGLIDLGRREGRKYMLDLLEQFVTRDGAPWFWHDINVEMCERYWDYNESPDRRGLMELRYNLGMQQVYAEFLRRHPEAIIEWCGSGGTMIDLGSLRFSHVLWISDYCGPNQKTDYSPDIGVAYRSRLNWIFPASLIMNSAHASCPEDQHGRRLPDEHLVAQCGGTFAVGQNLEDWSQADLDAVRQAISAHKTIRHLLDREFQTLFSPIPPPDKAGWDGWEFFDPETGEGALMIFRLRACEQTRTQIHPAALKVGSTWQVLLGQGDLEPNDDGFQVSMPATCRAVLVHYRRG